MGVWKDFWYGPDVETEDFSTLEELIVSTRLQQLAYAKGASLGVAAVFRARQLNADVPAALPVKASGVTLTNTQTRVVEIILALQDYGTAYLKVSGRDFTVLPNDAVVVRWDQSRTRRIYSKAASNVAYRVDGPVPNLVVLSINRGADDLVGMGWMQSHAIAGIIAIQKWAQEYFTDNAEPTGVFTVPGKLTGDEQKLLKAQVHGRSDGQRSPLFVSGGMTWDTTSFDAQSSQWVESHDAGVGDISAIAGVPPQFLAHAVSGSNLTYTNISDLWALYYRQTLQTTYISRIEEAWSRIMGVEVLFDPEQLLVASLEQRVRSASELVRSGFEPDASVDIAGLPPIAHTGEVPVTLQPVEGVV